MYAKLFTSIYQGTLRGNSHGLLVFTNLIAHADKAGQVDIHPRAISEEVGLTVDQVRSALDELEAPDAESRSPEEEGRRILRLDEHRAWGWRVVNYLKYRAIRNEDDRREQNRAAQIKWRSKQSKPASAKVSPASAQSAHTEAEAEALNTPTSGDVGCARQDAEHPPAGPKLVETPGVTACPHRELLALWAEVLPTLPQHHPDQWRGSRSDHLRARWRETAVAKHWRTQAEGITYFRRLFAYVGQSPFLVGQAHDPKRRPFFCELAWLVKPPNWAAVIEGKYHSETV